MLKIRKIFGFTGLILAMFMGALDATIVNIALPNIMADLHSNLTNTSWVSTIYALAMAVFIITAAKIADIYGRKKIMLWGIILFGLFSFACMTAQSLMSLIIYRFFQGVGGAILTPIVLPMGIELFGKKNTSKITAIMGATSALAAAGGPAIGGIIINSTSYQWIFGINIPLSILAFFAILWGTQESYDGTLKKNIDWFGMLFLTLTLSGITFGLLEAHTYGWLSLMIISSFAISLISLMIFIRVERTMESPLIELTLFKERTFTTSPLIYLLFGITIISPSLILNYFLQNIRGYSTLHAAYLIIPTSLSITISMPLATKMYQKINSALLIGIGLIITTGGLIMLSFMSVNISQSIIVCSNIIVGIGLGFTAMSLTSAIEYLPKDKVGIGSGIVNASRYIGQCLGIAILVTLLNQNINVAKHNIQQTAYTQIDTRVLSRPVKVAANAVIKNDLGPKNSNKEHNISQKINTKKVIKAAKKTNQLPIPSTKSPYYALYLAIHKVTLGNQASFNYLINLSKLDTDLSKNIYLIASKTNTLVNAQKEIGISIKLLAQKEEIVSALNAIKNTKNEQLSHAFSKVFMTNAVIVLLSSPIALLTNRRH